MTGRRLYDHHCDAQRAVQEKHYYYSALDPKPVAWPFLPLRDRRHWNELARRITPKPKKRAVA